MFRKSNFLSMIRRFYIGFWKRSPIFFRITFLFHYAGRRFLKTGGNFSQFLTQKQFLTMFLSVNIDKANIYLWFLTINVFLYNNCDFILCVFGVLKQWAKKFKIIYWLFNVIVQWGDFFKKNCHNYYIFKEMFLFLWSKTSLKGFLQKNYKKIRLISKHSVTFTP